MRNSISCGEVLSFRFGAVGRAWRLAREEGDPITLKVMRDPVTDYWESLCLSEEPGKREASGKRSLLLILFAAEYSRVFQLSGGENY